MLDRLADELFADQAPQRVLHTELAHELSENGRTSSGSRMPFAERGESKLKKVGAELSSRSAARSGLSSCPPRSPASAPPGRARGWLAAR